MNTALGDQMPVISGSTHPRIHIALCRHTDADTYTHKQNYKKKVNQTKNNSASQAYDVTQRDPAPPTAESEPRAALHRAPTPLWKPVPL